MSDNGVNDVVTDAVAQLNLTIANSPAIASGAQQIMAACASGISYTNGAMSQGNQNMVSLANVAQSIRLLYAQQKRSRTTQSSSVSSSDLKTLLINAAILKSYEDRYV